MAKHYKLCVWEPKDGYILDLLEKNKGNEAFCKLLVGCKTKAEKLAKSKKHRACFIIPEYEPPIMGSFAHVVVWDEVVKQVYGAYADIKSLEVVCGDKTWGKLNLCDMAKTNTVQ